MNALIIGADKIQSIQKELQRLGRGMGITRTEHWSGRSVGDTRRQVPSDTGLILVICSRLNHRLLENVRRQACKLGVPLIYSRYSVIEVRDKLAAFSLMQSGARPEAVIECSLCTQKQGAGCKGSGR